jgi:hypothetical protein
MADNSGSRVSIGKIVRSESHVRYTCQVYAPGEIALPPEPADYAFGSFMRMPLRAGTPRADVADMGTMGLGFGSGAPLSDALEPAPDPSTQQWAVGLIFDTILLNPAFGTLGPRLSSDEQVELFSPDYLSERAVLVSILLLGTTTLRRGRIARVYHGVPPLAPDLGAVVESLTDEDVRAFHAFAAAGNGAHPALHMGYLPHAVAQDHPLLPQAMLQTIERLERLLPANAAVLSIVKRNLAWRLKVEAAG